MVAALACNHLVMNVTDGKDPTADQQAEQMLQVNHEHNHQRKWLPGSILCSLVNGKAFCHQ